MKKEFHLTIFLPDSPIDPSQYSVKHTDLKSASFLNLGSEEGYTFAIYKVEMTKPYDVKTLEGNFCVTHPDVEVTGTDVFID
ncbi:hypothetical protein F0M16_11020 [Vibrio cholerae]|uniref:Uncharacterized protein n=1 Tax=Vibrio cholerae TaxID=666 RepID=A0A5Q6PJD8_VIBCL|nr:hypothetical protein [Vibrio cholerae]KAA1254790.1 hypothetical protein F0M16_11020 [Vibrio cholerae]